MAVGWMGERKHYWKPLFFLCMFLMYACLWISVYAMGTHACAGQLQASFSELLFTSLQPFIGLKLTSSARLASQHSPGLLGLALQPCVSTSHRGWNAGLCVYKASTLPTELPPRPVFLFADLSLAQTDLEPNLQLWPALNSQKPSF